MPRTPINPLKANEIPYASIFKETDTHKELKQRYHCLMKRMKQTDNLQLMNTYLKELNILEKKIVFPTHAVPPINELEPAEAVLPPPPDTEEYHCSICRWFLDGY